MGNHEAEEIQHSKLVSEITSEMVSAAASTLAASGLLHWKLPQSEISELALEVLESALLVNAQSQQLQRRPQAS